MVLALDLFLRPRGGIGLAGFARQLGGLVAMGLAGWVAFYAPVLGLAAKQTSNETSLDERSDATAAGLRAITERPWGGHGTEKQAGINLISDVAVNGLPFVLLVTAALLVPLLLLRRPPGVGARAERLLGVRPAPAPVPLPPVPLPPAPLPRPSCKQSVVACTQWQ